MYQGSLENTHAFRLSLSEVRLWHSRLTCRGVRICAVKGQSRSLETTLDSSRAVSYDDDNDVDGGVGDDDYHGGDGATDSWFMM